MVVNKLPHNDLEIFNKKEILFSGISKKFYSY